MRVTWPRTRQPVRVPRHRARRRTEVGPVPSARSREINCRPTTASRTATDASSSTSSTTPWSRRWPWRWSAPSSFPPRTSCPARATRTSRLCCCPRNVARWAPVLNDATSIRAGTKYLPSKVTSVRYYHHPRGGAVIVSAALWLLSCCMCMYRVGQKNRTIFKSV